MSFEGVRVLTPHNPSREGKGVGKRRRCQWTSPALERRQIDSTPGIVKFFGSSFWHRGSASPGIVAFLGVRAFWTKNELDTCTVRFVISVTGLFNCATFDQNVFCLPRGQGRFSLPSVLRNFKSCLLKPSFFLVLGLILDVLLNRCRHHFGSQKTAKKKRMPKKAENSEA